MSIDKSAVLTEFLADAFDPDKIEDVTERLVAEDATYVSLSFDNPDLKRLMPWAGTSHGKEAFVKNFRGVSKHWQLEGFTPSNILVDGDQVALFGQFTLRSVSLGIAATSPVAVLAEVTDGKIRSLLYMEDTFATARTFRSAGAWTVHADPGAEPFEI